MNQAMRIEPSSLEGKKALAVGYKIFDWNWGAAGNYCYADENGEVEGSVHTVTGPLDKCGWGLHYSKNPMDCMRYRDLIQWNKFALVEAYDENIDCPDKGKSLCRTMKIVKVLSFEEMLKEIKRVQKESLPTGYGIRNGSGIYDSSGIYNGYGISYGSGIRDSSGIHTGYGIRNGYGICNGSGIHTGYGIRGGSGISNSSGIRDGSGIHYSSGIRCGYGVNRAKFCSRCEGISRCLFCCGVSGKLMIFNKPVTEDRFEEVWYALGDWYPDFTNAEALKEKCGGAWKSTPASLISGRSAKEAYAEMPEALREYIKTMPEYDEELFRAITEEG